MNFVRIIRLCLIVFCFCGLLAAQGPLVLVDDPIPSFDAGVDFHTLLHARGGVPPYFWRVSNGDLPEGITLTREGLLAGRPSKAGDYTFTLQVVDSASPVHSVEKEFVAVVGAPLSLEWLDSPKVHDTRIDGSVQVSNGSKDVFDLTVVIMAVADNGRATAIGYQHFEMKPGDTNVKIPFGSALGYGGYVVHADAIAEILKKGTILRQRLQTPQPLQVLQSP